MTSDHHVNSPTVNSLIQAAGQGDREALDRAWPGLYKHLHEIAAAQMSREKNGHLLQTTAIVHEAYFRLSDQNRSQWNDQRSFFAAAAVVMRRVLIDSARREKAAKRGGQALRRELSDSRLAVDDQRYSTIDVHDALERLATFAADQAKVLELMIFGGLTRKETAEVLGVSESSIDRKVRSAKAWLRRELSEA